MHMSKADTPHPLHTSMCVNIYMHALYIHSHCIHTCTLHTYIYIVLIGTRFIHTCPIHTYMSIAYPHARCIHTCTCAQCMHRCTCFGQSWFCISRRQAYSSWPPSLCSSSRRSRLALMPRLPLSWLSKPQERKQLGRPTSDSIAGSIFITFGFSAG